MGILRSLALKGRRVETWQEIRAAVVEGATRDWNAHRYPFVRGADDGTDLVVNRVSPCFHQLSEFPGCTTQYILKP